MAAAHTGEELVVVAPEAVLVEPAPALQVRLPVVVPLVVEEAAVGLERRAAAAQDGRRRHRVLLVPVLRRGRGRLARLGHQVGQRARLAVDGGVGDVDGGEEAAHVDRRAVEVVAGQAEGVAQLVEQAARLVLHAARRLAGRVERLFQVDRIGRHRRRAQLVEQGADGDGGAGAVESGGAVAVDGAGQSQQAPLQVGAVAGQRLVGGSAQRVLDQHLGQAVPQRQVGWRRASRPGQGQHAVEGAGHPRVVPAQSEVDPAVFEADEGESQEASDRPVIDLMLDGEGVGAELELPDLVEHGHEVGVEVLAGCREGVDLRRQPQAVAVGADHALPPEVGAWFVWLQMQRSPGHAVGKEGEHPLDVAQAHALAHGSRTSTMAPTAACTSGSSVTARTMATSQARRGSMPPTASWAA